MYELFGAANVFVAVRNSAILVVVGLVTPGCQESRPARYPVEGKVVYGDGSPFPGGRIELESIGTGSPTLNARGVIAEDGTFRLTTFDDNDGAVAGRHRGIIHPPSRPVDFHVGQTMPGPVIDKRYRQYATSPVELVVEATTNRPTITVEKPPGTGLK